jgi:cytochrome c-type biogenesis protein CcmF
MPDLNELIYSSPLLGAGVTFGNLAIWVGLLCSITCVALYWTAMIRTMRRQPAAAASPDGSGVETNGGSQGKKGGGKSRAGKKGSTQTPPVDATTERIGLWARRFFFITCGCVIVGALSLWALVLAQEYTVQYVWKNSNRELPFGYRFASFWADQEGTFFLWGLYNVVLGCLLLAKTRQDERWVMPFFTLIHVSLFTLLAFMNPFWLPAAGEIRTRLQEAGAPPQFLTFLPTDMWGHITYYLGWAKYLHPKFLDAKGLNESLQNFWMVIHPPTLFVGYSSMIVPACFALGALMRRDYDSWVNRAWPWLAFAWGVLGFGIFLGAYWAYETLGWGGYWSWDPVENSSLIPWLFGTTLIHGMMAQRARGNFKQANLFIATLTGAAVLLGSFLVRSGVLSENSVHSFATPQKSVFITLLAILAIWFVMSVAIWLWRFKDIQSEIAYETVWERHFGYFLGLIVLSATAVVVTFGVTAPIWKPWLFGLGKKISIEYTFYNKALLPVVFVLVLLMALTPLMPWRQVRDRPMRPFNKLALALAGLFTLFFLFAGVWAWLGGFKTQNDPAYIGFGLILALAVVTNCVVMVRSVRGGLLNAGPWLAHLGFITLLAGVVITSRFNETRTVEKLEMNQSVTAFGKTFTWRGQRPAAGPADRDRLLIDVTYPDGRVVHAAPKLFVSKINGQTMAWPQIFHEGFNDLYLEPSGMDQSNIISLDDVKKGQRPLEVAVQHRRTDPRDTVWFSFEGLDTSEFQRAMQRQQQRGGNAPMEPVTLYANVVMIINGEEKRLRPALRLNPQSERPEPVPLRIAGLNQGTGYSLHFTDTNMKPGDLQASFKLIPDESVPQAYFQVLYVPGIQVLWFGCYVMWFGAFLCWRRRSRLARTESTPETGQRDRTPVDDQVPAATPERIQAGEKAPAEPAGVE